MDEIEALWQAERIPCPDCDFPGDMVSTVEYSVSPIMLCNARYSLDVSHKMRGFRVSPTDKTLIHLSSPTTPGRVARELMRLHKREWAEDWAGWMEVASAPSSEAAGASMDPKAEGRLLQAEGHLGGREQSPGTAGVSGAATGLETDGSEKNDRPSSDETVLLEEEPKCLIPVKKASLAGEGIAKNQWRIFDGGSGAIHEIIWTTDDDTEEGVRGTARGRGREQTLSEYYIGQRVLGTVLKREDVDRVRELATSLR